MNSYDYLYKYIIIGDQSVGKSCMMIQFTDDRFRGQYEATLGVEFGSKNISIADKIIKIQIWDTAGQESFKSITRSYYKGSIAAIIVYDITNRESFNSLQKWIDDVKELSNEYIQGIVCGNKIDLDSQREVSVDEGLKFAKDNNLLFCECSAKDNINVDSIFKQVAARILALIEDGKIDMQSGIGIKLGRKLIEENQKLQQKQQSYSDEIVIRSRGTSESSSKSDKTGSCSC